MEQKKRLAIACQGGGSQTAFTAGVLKAFLENNIHDSYDLVALSGTSGGAICALLTWYGLLKSANEPEIPPSRRLEDFWMDNSARSSWEWVVNESQVRARRLVETGNVPTFASTPYDWKWKVAQRTLLSLAPRKEFLDFRLLIDKHIDFEELNQLVQDTSPRLVVGACNVLSGAFRTFDSSRERITAEAILASAAVPTLFEAVEIDGEHYWDGLYGENPPISRLLQSFPHELWIIQINPRYRSELPTSAEAILDRRNELAGNIQLAIEVQALRTVNALLENNALTQEFLDKVPLKPIKLRLIPMGDAFGATLDYASKLDRNPVYIRKLMQEGKKQASLFLQNPDDGQFAPPEWWTSEEGVAQLVKQSADTE